MRRGRVSEGPRGRREGTSEETVDGPSRGVTERGCSIVSSSVLIADDSEFTRELLREMLDGTHHIVGEAENGRQAVDMFEEHSPDIVLMDIAMPYRNGIEATEEIKSRDDDVRVIVCTSVDQEEMMKEAIKAGANGYITKPFDEPDVLEAIDETVVP